MQCNNCGNYSDFNVCTVCGMKVVETNIEIKEVQKNNISYEKMLVIFAIIGILTMYGYRAWLGGPIYLISAYLAFTILKEQYNEMGINFVTDYVKHVFSKDNITRKMICVIVMLAPIVSMVALYRWVVVDTMRMVDSLY